MCYTEAQAKLLGFTLTSSVVNGNGCRPFSSLHNTTTKVPHYQRKRPRLSCYGGTTTTTTTTTATTTTPNKKKRIQFASDGTITSVLEVPSRADFSAEELECLWYKKEDLKQLKKQAVAEIRHYCQQQQEARDSGEQEASDSDSSGRSDSSSSSSSSSTPLAASDIICLRGLERRSRQGGKAYRANKTKAVQTVLNEQARQSNLRLANVAVVQNNGKVWLAQLYAAATKSCRLAAQERATEDAHAAAAIYWDSIISTTTCATTTVDTHAAANKIMRSTISKQ